MPGHYPTPTPLRTFFSALKSIASESGHANAIPRVLLSFDALGVCATKLALIRLTPSWMGGNKSAGGEKEIVWHIHSQKKWKTMPENQPNSNAHFPSGCLVIPKFHF